MVLMLGIRTRSRTADSGSETNASLMIMNTKVIAIFGLTIVAIVALWAYSFGPLSRVTADRVNPKSLQASGGQVVVSQKPLSVNVFHNRDLPENYFTVQFPQSWRVQSGDTAGSYQFAFGDGSGSVKLQDVADNTTLELFVLSQEEPSLKKTVQGYNRVDYQRITIDGNDAFQLTYGATVDGAEVETIKTYISGSDHACVITLSARRIDAASGIQQLYASVLDSFRWEK